MHSCAACLVFHRPSVGKQYIYFENTKLAMEILETATNCSVSNGEKNKNQQTSTSSPDFLAAQHLTELKRCDRVTGGSLHAFVSSCVTFQDFLLKFLNK